MPSIWRPPRRSSASPPQQDQEQEANAPAPAESYSGWGYVAQWGSYWELPCGSARVRAAQLQHRVPCWGYVIEELLPPGPPGAEEFAAVVSPEAGEGAERRAAATAACGRAVGRKVAILGDTVASAPMAPLALDCDVIAHEATFKAGMEAKCRVAQHSTGYLAGAFASCVRAKHLVLTHFSARYGSAPPPRGHKGQRPGAFRERPVDEAAEQQAQAREVWMLLREARSHFREGGISAAKDFFCFDVPRL
jgi:ribonuclease Z